MEKISVQQLVSAINGRIIAGDRDSVQKIVGINTDTRTIATGECFIALQGDTYDGHDFLMDAVHKRASVLVVEHLAQLDLALPLPPVVQVDSTCCAIGDLARLHRCCFSPVCIAITGSVGKTTTKEMISQVLARDYKILKSPKSFNNQLGVPLTLLQLTQEHQIAILEMGTNAWGEIAFLSELAQPTIGVITCVAQAHLQGFHNLDGVEKAKGELIQGMNDRATLVVNGDDPACMRIAGKFPGKVVTFGCVNSVDFKALDIQNDFRQICFRIEDVHCEVPIPGKHNVYNVLASISVARELKMPWEKLQDYVRNLSLPSMRMEIKDLQGITLIKDCYNSSPKAVLAALDGLRESLGKRKIAILGGMLELGEESSQLHYEVGQIVAKSADLLFCLGKESAGFIEGAAAAGMPACSMFHYNYLEEIARHAICELHSGDIVLIKGSRKFHLESLCEQIESAFSCNVS